MKNIVNSEKAYVDEMLDGLLAAHGDVWKRLGDDGRVIGRACGAVPGKVGIATGGGSGHLPAFLGYVGEGLLDACAIGPVFNGPQVNDCQAAMVAADGGAGVLQLYGNYDADKMNFDMARELMELQGMRVRSVCIADDVASAPLAERAKRRGLAGMVFVYKVAGACAAAGGSLAKVTHAAIHAAVACRSIGVALMPRTVPKSGRPALQIAEQEDRFGMGICGEPSTWRGKHKSTDMLAREMLDPLLAELRLERGTRLAVLLNSLGATPHEELYVIYGHIAKVLADLGVTPVMPLIGRYATSMETAGASLTLMPLDAELERLLCAPAHTPFWRV